VLLRTLAKEERKEKKNIFFTTKYMGCKGKNLADMNLFLLIYAHLIVFNRKSLRKDK
jgi:hypothetical protein